MSTLLTQNVSNFLNDSSVSLINLLTPNFDFGNKKGEEVPVLIDTIWLDS